jgi:hypothetical protein
VPTSAHSNRLAKDAFSVFIGLVPSVYLYNIAARAAPYGAAWASNRIRQEGKMTDKHHPKRPRMQSTPIPARYGERDGEHEANLAWDLVEAYRSNLSRRERDELFIRLGCRDFSVVIEQVLHSVVRSGQLLSEDDSSRASRWLSGFPDNAAPVRISDLLQQCSTSRREPHGRSPAWATLRG